MEVSDDSVGLRSVLNEPMLSSRVTSPVGKTSDEEMRQKYESTFNHF